MQNITAPNSDEPKYMSVFLAGGITNCKEWQEEVIKELEDEEISIYNPRQKTFDISKKDASYEQVVWEFERLEKMDIFSMYFCNDNSIQPICMYELGRNILKMQIRFPNDWEDRIVISVEDGYIRERDVLIQTELCAPSLTITKNANPKIHADRIKEVLKKLNR